MPFTSYTVQIDNTEIARLEASVKKNHPIPPDRNGNPSYTDAGWVEHQMGEYLKGEIARAELETDLDQQPNRVVPIDDSKVKENRPKPTPAP